MTRSSHAKTTLPRQDSPLLLLVATALVLVACSESGDRPAADFEQLDATICAPDQGPFTLEIDNAYLPLPVGRQLVLEGSEDGEAIRVEITVLDETEEVAGVTTRVVEEAEYEDGELVEISRNFFVQAPDQTVCYYGEDVDDYEDGVVVSNEGAWRAGVDGATPGILMPGTPRAQTRFAQENAPGIAEDQSAIIEVAVPVSTPAGDFADAVLAIDWNPQEGEDSSEGEEKYYARDIGLVVDEAVRLVSFN